MRRSTLALIFMLAVAGALVPCSVAQQADIVLHNGKVLTVDANFSIAEAMAVSGNQILAVGTNQEVLGKAGPNTTRIDLKGRTVIPGLALSS